MDQGTDDKNQENRISTERDEEAEARRNLLWKFENFRCQTQMLMQRETNGVTKQTASMRQEIPGTKRPPRYSPGQYSWVFTVCC